MPILYRVAVNISVIIDLMMNFWITGVATGWWNRGDLLLSRLITEPFGYRSAEIAQYPC